MEEQDLQKVEKSNTKFRLRLREQPVAAPRPRSLCLGPPGARGPAQAGHAGTEEAERTGSDGETGEEPAKRHPSPPSPTTTTITITDCRPSQLPCLTSHLISLCSANFIKSSPFHWVLLWKSDRVRQVRNKPQGRLTSQNKHSDRALALLGSPAPEGMNLLRRSKTYKKQVLKPSAFSPIG
ncbi:PREDICTED: uncharacterized protein LOC108531575 [Rhinopithecus bieti]|uniref:uncharacterized protein LOC108531575 n=1 Tax=Rhinopithecus bieti TaxID=61621 RepID=UPI00083C5E44|nr:PREDICTED: uncharacterized protein LOC108531575 [Rhinopithecus bieti]